MYSEQISALEVDEVTQQKIVNLLLLVEKNATLHALDFSVKKMQQSADDVIAYVSKKNDTASDPIDDVFTHQSTQLVRIAIAQGIESISQAARELKQACDSLKQLEGGEPAISSPQN